MPLVPGTHLGPYEILAPLGVGGMGEVYRARDPRMGREVAIKVSGERFSDRFDREVRAVAALNHPNICHIYDVGPNYLVMELVEGSTLAERIDAGAIPLEEALRIAHQIGDALEAAHEKGIIHRDLKPANIKLKPDGGVKVLDFGLAKIAEQAAAAGSPEESPTVAMGATIAGQIMGTAAYMAPEQARGKIVDKRADIWAFGVVLYEMLTGRRMFEGETISDVLAGVLTKEPDLTRVPAAAHRLLKSCLEKDPKRRLRDIGDAWRLLEDASVPAVTTSARVRWAVAGALVLALAIALWAPWRGAVRPSEQPAARLDFDLGPDVSLSYAIGPAVILSPDGTRLVFVSPGQDGVKRLFTRRLDQTKALQMAGTEGGFAPFFSPDGQWVAFFAQGALKKTRVDGGDPVALCDAPAARGGSWGEDGNIIAALDALGGLSQIRAEGGKAVPIATLDREFGDFTLRWPQVLPGAKAVLFNASRFYGNFDEAGIAVATLKDHRRKIVLEHGGMYPRYVPSGHLLYVTKGTLFAIHFDPERLEVRGAPSALGPVASNSSTGTAQFDVSLNGTLAYRPAGVEGLTTIQWLDGVGKTVPLILEAAVYNILHLSPDGNRLLFALSQGSSTDLWIYDWQTGRKTRLTNGLVTSWPLWSPDGGFVVFQAAGGMFWTRADAATTPQLLTQSRNLQLPTSFAPDGTLAFSEVTPGGLGEVRTVRVESHSGQLKAGEPQSFLKTPSDNAFAAFSPDGRWLAYANSEAGGYEVYVRAYPDNGTQVQISNAGGLAPVWSRNNHELFYRTEDQRVMVASYRVSGGSFQADKPRVWFGKQLANLGQGGGFDVAPDGKRAVVLMQAEAAEPAEAQHHVMLILNFFDEVRRRVGQTK